MATSAETTGIFSYLYPQDVDQSESLAERTQLGAAADVAALLRRWRRQCSDGLIDDTGKIRNVFTKLEMSRCQCATPGCCTMRALTGAASS
jgi:hypothetical protein